MKPNYLVILPPTQHHSFFRNLPPLCLNAYRLGKEIPNSNVRTYGNGMQPLCVYRKMASFKETEDLSVLSNDISGVKGEVMATDRSPATKSAQWWQWYSRKTKIEMRPKQLCSIFGVLCSAYRPPSQRQSWLSVSDHESVILRTRWQVTDLRGYK